jgi:hypothetical protein
MDLIRLPIFARVVKLIKSAFNTLQNFFFKQKRESAFHMLKLFVLVN